VSSLAVVNGFLVALAVVNGFLVALAVVNGFLVALGSAGTVNNVTTTGVLFHNRTMHHVGFQIDLEFSKNKENVRLIML
jgi:hypothetical protein